MFTTNYRLFRATKIILTIVFLIAFSIESRAQDKVIIKMATMAPNGSVWHDILKEMAMKWTETSGGLVELRIYPGGIAGDEGAIVRKIRIGQLQAGMITNAGLANISLAINSLVIPLMIDSYEKLDRVRQGIGSNLKTEFEEKGFHILNWVDAGWVRFFVPDPNPGPESVRAAKMFVWAGDDNIVELWKKSGFNAIPLAATDMLPALQTGMVNAFPTTAIMALASQWFAFTPYMIDLPWAPLIGATVIKKNDWERIPISFRSRLEKIAEETGVKMQAETRRLEKEAIRQMQKRGLKVIKPSKDQLLQWQKVMEGVYADLRGNIIPEKWFDAALKHAGAVDGNNNSDVSK